VNAVGQHPEHPASGKTGQLQTTCQGRLDSRHLPFAKQSQEVDQLVLKKIGAIRTPRASEGAS
jgi:hypothetical protein